MKKVILAAKIILFHFRVGSMLKQNIKIFKNNFTWNLKDGNHSSLAALQNVSQQSLRP